MYFESLQAALVMEGHGVYVWTVVAVSTLVCIGLLVLPARSARRFMRELAGKEATAPQAAPGVRIEEVNNASSS